VTVAVVWKVGEALLLSVGVLIFVWGWDVALLSRVGGLETGVLQMHLVKSFTIVKFRRGIHEAPKVTKVSILAPLALAINLVQVTTPPQAKASTHPPNTLPSQVLPSA